MKHISKALTGLLTFTATAVLLAGLTGCGGGQTEAQDAPVTSIRIEGNDRMRFSVQEFTVTAGTEITVEFANVGRMPKESMGHNLAIIDKSLSPTAFSAAAIRHPATEYIAPEYADQVIAATKVLGPGESETIVFRAPSATGDYPFVCSFPGHTEVGMRGIMRVVAP